MKIVFGTNSLLIKSYTPIELGFSNSTQQDWKIEHRQSYFHLYWLPTIPTGRVWCIKKPNDSNRYELSSQQIEHIESLGLSHRFNWFSLTLPLLLLAGFLGFILFNYYKGFQHENDVESYFKEKTDFFTKKINSPSKHDYIIFNAMDDSSKSSTIYCKVVDFNKDSIKLAISDSVIVDFDIEYFKSFRKNNALKTQWIAKKDLMKTQKTHTDDYLKRVKILYFNESNSLVINEIKEIDGPFFEQQSAEFDDVSQTVSAIVTNEGYPVKILGFKKENNKNYIDWNVTDVTDNKGQKFKFVGTIKRDREVVKYNEENANWMINQISSEVICKDLETSRNVTIEIHQYESNLRFFRSQNKMGM
jgi:hypothetical protein